MSSSWFGRLGVVGLVTAAVISSGAAAGCAAEREPINRVQLNAMPKSFFVGARYSDPADDPEFYGRTMVIDVPYGESGSDFLMFTNTINSVSRLRWQIDEDFLIGRISFERIDGTDAKGAQPTAPAAPRDPNKPIAQQDGVEVYKFRIQSHFDIRFAYNPQTGEEMNVVEENVFDRPWVDRDYIRVDFSENLNTSSYDFDTLALLNVFNGVQYSSAPYDVQNPNDENAPAIDVENGYFDVTTKVFAQPQMIDLGGWVIPGCLLPNIIRGGSEPTGNCNANEITLRHAFKRVADTDYEPVDWDGQRFETYGAFTTQRNGYARDYGLADSRWRRFISRYNIWERSHYYADPDKLEGAVACKVDSQCGELGLVEGMSRCDTFQEKCALPYNERKAKPIAWHYSDKSTPAFYDATAEATDEWDTAMRIAVQTAKYAECQRFTADEDCEGLYPGVTKGNFAEEEDAMALVKEVNACRRAAMTSGGDPKACDALADEVADDRRYSDAVRAVAKQPEMVVLCHSPVRKEDDWRDARGERLCGPEGRVARLGDLRYHLVSTIDAPQTGSPWGIMTDGNDPLTGEHISGSMNVWAYRTDQFARALIDTLRYIGGELTTEDVTDGRYVHQWVDAARRSNGVGLTPVVGVEESDKRIAAAAGTTLAKMREVEAKYGKFGAGVSAGPLAALKNRLVANLQHVSTMKAAIDAPSVFAPKVEARMKLLRNGPGEAEVVTPAMQEMARSALGDLGQIGLKTNDGNFMNKAASVLQGMNPAFRRNLEQRLELALADRGSCVMHFEATAPLGYVALGDVLQQKFGSFNPADPTDVQLARAERMKDWLRRRAHYAVVAHEMGHSFGLRHNFVSSSDAWNYRPQYWALRTNAKTVTRECDERGASNGATCIGPRWLDRVTANEMRNMIQMWSQSSTMEYAGEPSQELLGLGVYDFAAARMFYADTATVYAEARFNQRQAAGSFAIEHQNDFGGLLGFRYGSFTSPTHYSQLDNEVGLIEGCDTSVKPEVFRPAGWNEERDGIWNPIVDGHLVTDESGRWMRCTQPRVDHVQWSAMRNSAEKTHSYDPRGRVRVPHGFASDEWADLGNVTVYRGDNGADIYETMHFWIAQQEMNHIFSSYRRGRRDFSIYEAFNRTLVRYLEKMRDAAKAVSLYVTLAKDSVALYNDGTDPSGFAGEILKQYAPQNALASTIAFDHLAHVFSRPQPGDHDQLGTEVSGNAATILRSCDGTGFSQGCSNGLAGGARAAVRVANGVTGGYGTISLGGRPIENALARNKGRDYDREYTLNVGSYYEKAFTAMLLTESADNFISSSRDDYVDPRFRAVSIADVFPDGFRRWLANNLTNDEAIKGVYVRGGGAGTPTAAGGNFVVLGNTSWWPEKGLEACFPVDDRISCRDPFATGDVAPPPQQVVDPQVGWEQQRFAILFSLLHIPDNQKTNWLDQMRVFDLGVESDPGFDNRIEFHDPLGHVYVAQTFGTETLFGKVVQKGIAARVLEYANEVLQRAVETEPVERAGRVVGYRAMLDADGNVVFKQGDAVVASCDNSRDCTKLKNYVSVPRMLWQMQGWLGYVPFNGLKGIY